MSELATGSQSQYPQAFHCPITLQLMKDPYCDKDGNSYEGEAIKSWVSANGCSPITRNPLTLADLTPNRALKDLIQETLTGRPTTVVTTPSGPTVFPTAEQVVFKSFVDSTNSLVHLSIAAIEGNNRFPVDVCCVIDVSGSMDTEVSVKTASGATESNGLSTLDVVKHAVRTIVGSLGEFDTISIVSFADEAMVDLDPTLCNSAGQKVAMTSVEALVTRGSTNLWAGLKVGLDLLQKVKVRNKGPKRMAALFLLTDGQPNVEPPRGHVPMLQQYKDKNGGVYPCSINTFGFGYNLDSKLLDALSYEGSGSYAFIPDAAMVGTVFINALSNLLITAADQIVIKIESETPLSKECILGNFPTTVANWGAQISLGSLQIGQSRDLVVKLPALPELGAPIFNVSLQLELTGSKERVVFSAEVRHDKPSQESIHWTQLNYIRLRAVEAMRASLEANDDSAIVQVANDLKAGVETFPNFEAMAGLYKDISGEALMACKHEYFTRWGRHYLPSLSRAHQLQQCNNFKDPGVQFYAGTLFGTIRDKIDDVFCNLPAPVPSRRHNYDHAPAYGGSSQPLNSMASYNTSAAPCFHGKCKVTLLNGSAVRVDELTPGDLLQGGASIDLILETRITDGKEWLVELPGGLLITPWHPIKIEGKWMFPANLKKPQLVQCSSVFSFVLNANHEIVVDGICCVTLGHGCTDENDVRTHPFFGCRASVVKAVGRQSGKVLIQGTNRDPITLLAYGFNLGTEHGDTLANQERQVSMTV